MNANECLSDGKRFDVQASDRRADIVSDLVRNANTQVTRLGPARNAHEVNL
jgi:hypothetical protein